MMLHAPQRSSTMTAPIFRDENISRERMLAITAAHPRAAVFESCILDGGDFSRLDMDGFRFEHCSLAWPARTGLPRRWRRATGTSAGAANVISARRNSAIRALTTATSTTATGGAPRFLRCSSKAAS
jgi:fluoroquinolone resistance protein